MLAFFDALANEAALDSEGMRAARLDDRKYQAIPRAYYHCDLIRRYPRASLALARALQIIFPLVLYPVALTASALATAFAVAVASKAGRAPFGDVIVCTTRGVNAIAQMDATARPRLWLTVPWVRLDTVPRGEAQVSLMTVARMHDVLWALQMSCAALPKCRRLRAASARATHLYVAYRWFFVWSVLQRTAQSTRNMWFSNHYDRWAILLDRLPTRTTRVMVQHGVVNEVLHLPRRLRHVAVLFAMDPESAARFRRNVFAARANVELRRRPVGVRLADLTIGTQGEKTVLIIGQILDLDKDCAIIDGLLSDAQAPRIIYKPHPICPAHYVTRLRKYPIEIITARQHYPRVTVAVSHSSTLGVEYEASGVPVVWHRGVSAELCLREIRKVLDQARL